MPRWERALFGALLAMMGALFAYLFGYCCLFTSVFEPGSAVSEHVLYLRDNVLMSLLTALGGVLLLRLTLRWEARIDLRWLTAAALLVTFALGCAWALMMRAQPVNDPGILHYTAAELARGNVEELARHTEYLRVNPFQAGYMQYAELLQRVFDRGSTLPQQLLNAAYLTIAYGAVMDIVWRSLRDRRVQIVTTLLMMTALQPVLYVTMLYGNVPGLCFALLSLWALLRWVQGGRALWLLPALAAITVAVVLKPNYLIAALAMALVCAMYAFGAKRYLALAVALALTACPLLGDKAAQMLLEKRTGFALGEGAPQTTWLAMGMQEGDMAPGWYNRYTLDTYEAAGEDMQEMVERNREAIAERLK